MCLVKTFFRWEAGPKPIDGLWAPWWYESIHRSTGFTPSRKFHPVSGWLWLFETVSSV